MSNFNNSVGGAGGSGSIGSVESVGLSQSPGGPVSGYSGTTGHGAGKVPPQNGPQGSTAQPIPNAGSHGGGKNKAKTDGKGKVAPSGDDR